MNPDSLRTAHARIADCLQRDSDGGLVQRRDSLNLAGLGLTDKALATRFDPGERGLPEIGLADLPHLRYLDLTGNDLTRLPDCVLGFTELVWLGLNFNRISALPEGLGRLRKLRRFYLRGNGLRQLPADFGEMVSLVDLDLTGCEISQLPLSMSGLGSLGHVAFEENALAPDLRSAWKEGKWEALRAHLERLGSEKRQVQHGGKVILVGSQEHGKTCLQRALRGEGFVEGYVSTDGMSRERLHLRLDGTLVLPEERDRRPGPREDIIDLTIWDMGGQESYQHTHQMFFTVSAVYLVVTLPRQGGEVQKLDDWIELVKRRTGGKATIVVVSTKCRKNPLDKSVTLDGLQAKHGIVVRDLVKVDSGDDPTGILELRRKLAILVQETDSGCRHEWLRGWAKVLAELSAATTAFLRWNEIEALCAGNGVRDPEEQRQVVRTAHYIGAVLWREDIPAGQDVVILNPDWLCRAVARLLDDAATRNSRGLVRTSDLPRLWSGEGRDGTPGYPAPVHPALIELMEINELAYRPRRPGQRTGDGDLLLVTQMVEDKPRRDVELAWERIRPEQGEETVRVVGFKRIGEANFEAVPDIVYLLIFRLRELSLGARDYTEAVHWQKGLLVRDSYGNAGRIELEGNFLRIRVRHRLIPGLMHTILDRIGVSEDGYWNGRGLEQLEFVVGGHLCPKGTPDKGLVSIEDCVEGERNQNKSVQCQTCRKYLDIRQLLNQQPVESDQTRQFRQWLEPILRDLVQGNERVLHEVKEQGELTRQRIDDLWNFVQMQGDAFLDAFTSEWKDGPRLFSLLPIPGEGWNPRDWVEMKFRITVWCEASRRPVPVFRKPKRDKPDEYRGSEILTLPREWVLKARGVLKWSQWAVFAITTGGAGGIGALVSAAGGVISNSDARQFATELTEQMRAFKDLADALPADGEHSMQGEPGQPGVDWLRSFGLEDRQSFGTPVEGDKALIRHLRDEYEKRDPDWGGLEVRDDGKFGRIWAHPSVPRD